MMNQNLEEMTSQIRLDKERFNREANEKNTEIEGLKSKVNRLEGEVKRKEEEIYAIKNDRTKISHQYEEALIKYNLKNSQFEKENMEQVQEKRKYEEDIENLHNLLTKKYHKLNQSERNNERRDVNLDEKVRKLHDLEEELKSSMRTKTVVSPERGKISTPLLKNKNDFNKPYYSTLTMKKSMASAGTKK